MGGHYGSVQVRTEDGEAVRLAAEAVARERGIKCLVGPALKGWVGVYPEQNGQDESVGEAIVGRVGGVAIHVMVHDDDVLAYWLWRDGALVDSFYSRPGYFVEGNRAAEEAMAGRPEVLAELAGGSVERLRELLRRDDAGGYTFEGERLEKLARVLGIRNAVTAYEYLKGGETEGVTGWRKFVEVPADAVTDEKSARQAERKRIAAETKRLKAAGLLLAEETRKGSAVRACAAGDGFLVAWHTFLAESKRPDGYWYRPPWTKPGPFPIEISGRPPASVINMARAGAGGRVALARPNGTEVYDVRNWSQLSVVVEREVPFHVALSADASRVAGLSRDEVVVSEVASGRRLAAAAIRGANVLAIHPSGKWVVTGVRGVATLDVESGRIGPERLVGGRAELPAAVAAMAENRLAAFDVDEFIRIRRAMSEAGIVRAVEMLEKYNRVRLPEGQVEQMRRQAETELERDKDHILRLKAQGAFPQVQGKEQPLFLCFSPDGERLWCGTDHGTRGYAWRAVLETAGAEDMPQPEWRFDPTPVDPDFPYSGAVHALEEEPEGTGALFGGYDGRVYRMDLASGKARDVLTPLPSGRVIQLAFSSDGAAVGMVRDLAIPHRPGTPPNPGCIWQVWSRRALS